MEDILSSKHFRVLIVGSVAGFAGIGTGQALAQNEMAEPVSSPAAAPEPTSPTAPPVAPPTSPPVAAAPAQTPASESKGPDPFAFADFGWMNGQSRQTDFPMAGKILNPMFTIDVGYNYDFSDPVDHTIVGSTSAGRSNEIQIMHLGLGTDVNYKGARGRLIDPTRSLLDHDAA